MRTVLAVAALAAIATACAPESDKTNPAIATDESAAERAASAPASGASSFTQEQARDQAVKAGYADIGSLTQAADGTWQGTAMKDGSTIMVVVDYQGNVTTRGASASPAMPQSSPTSGTSPAPAPTTPNQ